jgi:hypothetical protein
MYTSRYHWALHRVKVNGVHYSQKVPTVTSLKTFIPTLAAALDMKPAAIYERQRALMRAGLLKVRPGKGPGSGVLADAESLAMLLISLATPSLSEVERQTKALAGLKSRKKSCPVTGKRTFASALAAVLQSEELAKRASFFQVERGGTEFDAAIGFDSPGRSVQSERLSHFGKNKAIKSNLYTLTLLGLNFEEAALFLKGKTP